MSRSTIRIRESIEELDDLAASESSRAKLNRLAVLRLYALFVRSGETEPVAAIAQSVGVSENTVQKWLEVYAKSGISALLSGSALGEGARQRGKGESIEAPEEAESDDVGAAAPRERPASIEDAARQYVVDDEAAFRKAAPTTPVHDGDSRSGGGEKSVVLGNLADRYRFVFDEGEDESLDSDPDEQSTATTKSSFKDELRLRARVCRRAVSRLARRLLRAEDPASALERVTRPLEKSGVQSSPPGMVRVDGGSDTLSADYASKRMPTSRPVSLPMPLARDTASREKGKAFDTNVGSFDGAWVLVAETDSMIASIIKHRLEKQGANVFLAPDGMEVVSTLWTRDFDLLVTAVALPGLDGFEITRWVRDSNRHRSIPVMVMSWPGNESDLVRAFEAGADDFIYKPFSPVELITRLKRLVRPSATGGGTAAASDAA